MRNASEAQVRYLTAWERAFPSELKEVLSSHGLSGSSFDDLEMSQASLVIAEMVAKYGKPKKGEDEQGHGEGHQGRGDGEGDDYNDGRGRGHDGDGHDGNGNGDGDGQNGDGQQGQGDGQQDGQDGDGDSGDGDGDDGNGNDNGGQMDNPFRDGSKEQIVAQALIDNDMDKQRAYEQIKDQIGQKPLEFMQNVNGGREPLPLGSDNDRSSDKTQKGRARKLINDTYKKLLEHQEENGGNGQGQGQGNGGGHQQEMQYQADILLAQINRAREIADQMNADGEPFDTVGLRPYEYGARMLAGGMTVPAILDSMTMTWPAEVRRELHGKKMPEFDHRKFKATEHDMPMEVIEERLAPLAKKTDGKSLYLPTMVTLAEAGVPIMQVGEKGTGKTTNASHLAEALAERWDREMRFGFASMTSGTSPGEFKGRITLEGFLPSLFETIYEDGGVFLFDELDAGDENLLTLLNSALANGYFVNQQGKVIEANEQFVPVSAANTMGLGANGRYTGRNRLDAATLDRWAMGRVRVQFDQQLAEFIYWTQLAA